MSRKVVNAYRRAARELFGANNKEAENYIREPKDDPGEWAPNSMAIIYLEPDMRFKEDTGCIPNGLSYWDNGHENCVKLTQLAGCGYIEYINAAVAAVYY